MTTATRKQTSICAMWRKKSKEGKSYFTGMLDKETFGKEYYLKGFINGKKKNPNEPDLRIYESNEKELGNEIIALWQQTSKNNKTYFTGKITKDAPQGLFGKYVGAKVVAFPGDHSNEKAPWFKVYLQNEVKQAKNTKTSNKQVTPVDEFEEDLAF